MILASPMEAARVLQFTRYVRGECAMGNRDQLAIDVILALHRFLRTARAKALARQWHCALDEEIVNELFCKLMSSESGCQFIAQAASAEALQCVVNHEARWHLLNYLTRHHARWQSSSPQDASAETVPSALRWNQKPYLKRSRAPSQSAENELIEELPPRLRSLAELKIKGLTNTEVADALGLSLRTVQRKTDELRIFLTRIANMN